MRIYSSIVVPDLVEPNKILIVRLIMNSITKKEALKLKKYLETEKDMKLELLYWNNYGKIQLYTKNDHNIYLRYKILRFIE